MRTAPCERIAPMDESDGPQRTNPGFLQRVSLHSISLAVVLIVAAALRFYDLDRTSIWVDEAVSWKQAGKPFLKMLSTTARDNYPPLYNIILNFTITLFGDSETALRAPSALLGVGTVYLLYWLGTLLWDRTTGLIAALLLALSGFHVWYSTEARMYTLLSFTATLFVLTVVQATRRPNWVTLAGCAAAGTVLLYSHVYGSFIFAGVSLYVWAGLLVCASWVKLSWRGWIVSQAVAVALFLPWAFILLGRTRSIMGNFWIPEPTSSFVLKQLASLAGGTFALAAIGMFLVLSLVNVAALRTCVKRAEPTAPMSWLRVDWQSGMVLAWLIAPIMTGYLISIIGQPIFHGRYLIGALPAALLLAGRGVSLMSPRLLPFTLALVIGVLLPGLQHNLEKTRPDHRTAMQEFSVRYRPTDNVIYIGSKAPSQFYFREPVEKIYRYHNRENIPDDVIKLSNRFWLIAQQNSSALEEFVKRAERTHQVSFSITKDLRLYLFELAGAPR